MLRKRVDGLVDECGGDGWRRPRDGLRGLKLFEDGATLYRINTGTCLPESALGKTELALSS
jgi:hypothetical protein